MTQYLIGFFTQDEDIKAKVEYWISGHHPHKFSDEVYAVKHDLSEHAMLEFLRETIYDKGRFFIMKWEEPVWIHPHGSFPLLPPEPNDSGI